MLVVADIHYPDRARAFPTYLPRGVDVVAGIGDYTTYESLLELASHGRAFVGVRGNSDRVRLPERAVVVYRNVVMGLYHGHNIHPRGDREQLREVCEELGCDVLLTGHTHRLGVEEYKGIIIANPGSATGAWGGSTAGEPKTALVVEVDEAITFKAIGDVERIWTFPL